MQCRLAPLAAACLLAASLSFGQVAGRITGSVVDGSGAAIPGATVSLQLPGSGSAVYSTVSSAQGDYSILTVNPGSYDLVIDAKGFLKSITKGVKVDGGRSTDIPVAKLDLQGVSQTVEISEAAATVETSNAEVATTISRKQIEGLPVLNRSPLAFLQSQAGINNARGSTTVNGQRATYVNVTMDGINIQDNFIRTNDADFLPNLLLLDQIAEVNVITSNASAAVGGGASQVQFVSPSGTNQLHGGVVWSNRNNAFAANTWFNNQSGVKNPFLNQNQAGAYLGGPVKKNKLFFYSNYEAFRLRQQSSSNNTVLTPDARAGLFTYRDSGGAVQKVNILQAMGIQADPAVAALLQKVPATSNNFNVGDSTSALLRNTAGYQFLKRNNRTRDNVLAKSDYLFSPKSTFTVNYTWNRDIVDRPDQDTTFETVPSVANNEATKFLSSSWRYSPTATITNELRFGFNWAPAIFLATQDIPKFFLIGTTATNLIFTNPINTFRTQGRNTDTYHLADNANWLKGRHTFAFGYQMQRTRIEVYNDAGITPAYTLGLGSGNQGLSSAQLPGISASDLLAANNLLGTLGGYYSNYSQTFNVSDRTSGYVKNFTNLRHLQLDNYALYFQDSWKMNRRLTITAGVRWDYLAPLNERDSLALLPVLSGGNVINTILNPATPTDFAGSSAGRPFYKSDKNNFAPNLGMAFDPTGKGKWSIRAGYGVFFVNDSIATSARGSFNSNAGLSSTATAAGLTGRVTATGVPTIATPIYKVPRSFADNYALSSTNTQAIPDPNLVTPYVQQWNFNVQRVIRNTKIEARYIGNHGTKALRAFDYNQVIIKDILPDFQKAQNNGLLAQKATGSFNPVYNANIVGSVPLPFFNALPNGGQLTNATNLGFIQTGQVGELASNYQTTRQNGSYSFFPNPNLQTANVLTNFSNSSYNAFQLDINHSFTNGIQFQTNYVFSKVLSDAAGNTQTNVEPFLDIRNTKIERARPADIDITHSLKFNGVYELPLGKGHRLDFKNGVLSRLTSGWNMGGIITKQSGPPFSVLSGRGTLNRSGQSGNNTATSLIDKDGLNHIFQLNNTPNGPFIVPQTIKGSDGRAVAADGAVPFSGQLFVQPEAGGLGALQRNYFNGPWVFNMDAQASKITKITEGKTLEFRAVAANVFNHPTWFVGDQTVSSVNFGKITSSYYGRRVLQFELRLKF